MYDDLLFGTSSSPTVVLKKLPFDDITKRIPGYRIINDTLSTNKLGGHSYMVRLAESVLGAKRLVRNDQWDWEKVNRYLGKKITFLELLMLESSSPADRQPRAQRLGL